MQKQFDVVIRSLRDTLHEHGVEDIFELSRGNMRICPEKIECDLYDFIKGDFSSSTFFILSKTKLKSYFVLVFFSIVNSIFSSCGSFFSFLFCSFFFYFMMKKSVFFFLLINHRFDKEIMLYF